MNCLNSDTSLNMNKDGPQTHEEAVEFVKNIFKSMGGNVIEMPPHRPNKGYRYKSTDRNARDAFCMDFENDCLRNNWDGWKPFPTGRRRLEDPEWATMIKSQVYPHHSDIDWYEYVEYCQLGGGDEWFQEEEE